MVLNPALSNRHSMLFALESTDERRADGGALGLRIAVETARCCSLCLRQFDVGHQLLKISLRYLRKPAAALFFQLPGDPFDQPIPMPAVGGLAPEFLVTMDEFRRRQIAQSFDVVGDCHAVVSFAFRTFSPFAFGSHFGVGTGA